MFKLYLNSKARETGINDNVLFYVNREALEFVNKSLKKTPTASCKSKIFTDPAVLVSLRQSQFSWVPIYILTGEDTVTQLVDDNKISWLSRLKSHKATLVVTTVEEPPFVTLVKQLYDKQTHTCSEGILCEVPKKFNNVTKWEHSCCIGSIMDLLKKLQADLWLAIDLHIVEDGFYGSLVNGKWNGLIGELVTGKTQMVLASITSTTKRSTVVEFGESYVEIAFAILLAANPAAETELFNFSFVANVTGDLLLVLLLIFIFGLLILYATENMLRYQKVRRKSYAFKDGFLYLSGITFQRDLGGKHPEQGATRAMFVFFAFAMVIIMTTYTATLTAVQVKQEDNNAFKGMKDSRVCIIYLNYLLNVY